MKVVLPQPNDIKYGVEVSVDIRQTSEIGFADKVKRDNKGTVINSEWKTFRNFRENWERCQYWYYTF